MGLNLPGSRPPDFSYGYYLPGPSIPPVQTWAVPTQSYPGSQIRYFLTRSAKRDPMSSLQGRNPGRNVAKSSDIDFFLKADKTSLKELTNSELCETEG
jgi:hypothetical protein